MAEALANGELVAEGEWLKATANREFILAPGLQSRNPIVRVVFSDRAEIWVRRAHTKPDDAFYSGTFRRANAMITLKAKSLLRLAETPLSDTLEGEHEAVFAAQGETLTLWLDGRQVVTAQDRTHSSGGISLMMSKGDANGDCRIKKVEYGELPDAPPAK